jgi:F0F1-type ATP synthase membrane subunit b/b'
MSINWFEVTAQIINFFLILFILQKLLYKPVLKAMAERQRRTLEAQIEADNKMSDANKLVANYERKVADIEGEKRRILDDAKVQAGATKEDLLEKYKTEAESKRRAYLKEIEDEKYNFTLNLRKNLGASAIKIASHLLASISSKDLEDEVFGRFIENLKDLRHSLPNFDSLEEETVNIHSYRDLSHGEKQAIENALQDYSDIIKTIIYQKDPKLVLGYELNLDTYTFHANIENYLNIVEKEIIENLDANQHRSA